MTGSDSSAAPAAAPAPVAREGFITKAGKPIRQIGKFMFVLTMIGYFFWNLPGFMNIMSARKVKKTRECTIRGYTKALYFYPIVPMTMVLWALDLFGASSFVLAIVGCIALFTSIVVATEDIKGSSALGALGVFLAIAASIWALEASDIDVSGWFRDRLGDLAPRFDHGSWLLLAILIGAMQVVLFLRAVVKSSLKIDGNEMIAMQLGRTTPFPITDWRLRSAIGDWWERFWMGATNLEILSNYGAGSGKKEESGGAVSEGEDRAAFVLTNVPGGSLIEGFLLEAFAELDVEDGKRPSVLDGAAN